MNHVMQRRSVVPESQSAAAYGVFVAGTLAVLTIAAIPQFLVDAAGIVTALVAVCGGAAILSRLKPVKWFWRNLVSDPIGEWTAKWFRSGAAEWHADNVEPRLVAIERNVEVAVAWGEVLADQAGIPANSDPRELRKKVRNGGHT